MRTAYFPLIEILGMVREVHGVTVTRSGNTPRSPELDEGLGRVILRRNTLKKSIVILAAAAFMGMTTLASASASSANGNHHGTYHSVSPNDSVLYDNGGEDNVNAYTINNGFSVTDSFALAAEFDVELGYIQHVAVPRRQRFVGGLGDHDGPVWREHVGIGHGVFDLDGPGHQRLRIRRDAEHVFAGWPEPGRRHLLPAAW